MLHKLGLTVYVDWIDDPELDRSKVSEATAGRLRHRMNHSKSLMFATSRASSASKWMPWELGYFDGKKGSERVSICPIETGDTGNFAGQEYLGLYKVIEKVADQNRLIGAAIHPTRTKAERIYSFGKGSSSYRSVRDEYNFGQGRKRFADV
ncbi:hypothetical protein ACFQZZ_33125 [Nocardia sp. GCM10030253]|uniref:hypothetical protein n=1 Tax=Nocardia sp. GCM10030253 TaxID=3273404 RepID=UPI00363232F9